MKRPFATVVLLAVLLAVAGPGAAAAPAPLDERAADATRRVLPAGFIEFRTKRFLVFSDADPRWARRQASRLERRHHQFVRFTRRLGLVTQPLDRRLVCVLFDDRDDYRAFARRHDGVEDTWVAGYYTPENERVVFYRGDSNPSVVDARAQLASMQAEIEQIDAAARAARGAGQRQHARALAEQRERYAQHMRNEHRRVSAFASQISIATVVHETVHQLMFETGVQSPHVQYPTWISEGLATTFETDETGTAFGPEHEYAPRREAFRAILRDDRLVDLADLVTWNRIPADGADDLVHVVYHQSYALVTWMCRARKRELVAYLASMATETSGAVAPTRHLELFEQAFGDVEQVDRAWRRYEDGRLR